jgi:hypothetical protein
MFMMLLNLVLKGNGNKCPLRCFFWCWMLNVHDAVHYMTLLNLVVECSTCCCFWC